MLYRICLSIVATSVMTGCLVGPEYERVTPAIPDQYLLPQGVDPKENIANIPFWNFFKSPELVDLIRTGLNANHDLALAVARIEEAEGRVGFVRADQFPRADVVGSAGRTDPSNSLDLTPGKPFNSFLIGSDLSFELDLWGKLRHATAAERANLLASEAGLRTVTLALVSEIARTYFLLLDLDNRCAITDRTLKNRRRATSLISDRFQGGVVNELDVHQAEIEEADAAATRESLERQRRQVENALNVLLGRVPQPIARTAVLSRDLVTENVPTGFPAELLSRRPDVVAAESSAMAEFERIGVAEALRFPSLSLFGRIGLNSSDTSDFFNDDAFTWEIGAGLLGPLIDFGKNRARVEVAKAIAKQQVETYQQSVLVAVREVEDSSIQIVTYRNEQIAREVQQNSASKATRLSRARYDDGVTAYLEVLDIERSLFSAELANSEALQLYLSSIVRLYAALGGGWEINEQTKEQAKTNP